MGQVSADLLSQSLTIHGLWPDLNSTESFGAFNVQLLEKNVKLLDDMHNYWPPKSKASSTVTFLWDHEWSTHGKDYANIVYKLRPQDFPGTTA
jgi:ribonuclease I